MAAAPFDSPYRHDFVRVSACVPRIEPACPSYNGARTLDLLKQGDAERVALMVFPELGLSAYAIDDLHQQDALLDAVDAEIATLLDASKRLFPAFAVGAPIRSDGRLYNTAVIIHRGEILGVIPKIFLPTYREFYERRWFAPGDDRDGYVPNVVYTCGSIIHGDDLFIPFALADTSTSLAVVNTDALIDQCIKDKNAHP